jgi:hypothetical protein
MTKKALILVCCLGMAGCTPPHFKDLDSYHTEFRDSYTYPESVNPMPQKGDPYTFGGVGEGSGGTMARQSFATDTTSPDFRDATDTGKLGEIAKDRTQTPDRMDSTAPTTQVVVPSASSDGRFISGSSRQGNSNTGGH